MKHKADSAAKAIQSTLIMANDKQWSEEICNEFAASTVLRIRQCMTHLNVELDR